MYMQYRFNSIFILPFCQSKSKQTNKHMKEEWKTSEKHSDLINYHLTIEYQIKPKKAMSNNISNDSRVFVFVWRKNGVN